MAARGLGVGVASIVGSFLVYGAHVACGGGARVVPTAPAQPAPAAPPVATPAQTGVTSASVAGTTAGGSCGCPAPRTTAWMTIGGDEKIALDPVDADASLEVAYGRGPGGKRRVEIAGVVRAFRTDVPAERPTTFSIRVTLPDPTPPGAVAGVPAAAYSGLTPTVKDVEAYLSTWSSGGAVAPRVYATVTKAALTVTVSGELVEIRGGLTLKDVPTGRTLTIDKLSLRKAGAALLPDRTGALRAP